MDIFAVNFLTLLCIDLNCNSDHGIKFENNGMYQLNAICKSIRLSFKNVFSTIMGFNSTTDERTEEIVGLESKVQVVSRQKLNSYRENIVRTLFYKPRCFLDSN